MEFRPSTARLLGASILARAPLAGSPPSLGLGLECRQCPSKISMLFRELTWGTENPNLNWNSRLCNTSDSKASAVAVLDPWNFHAEFDSGNDEYLLRKQVDELSGEKSQA